MNDNNEHKHGFWHGVNVFLISGSILILLLTAFSSFFNWSTKSKTRGTFFSYVVFLPFMCIIVVALTIPVALLFDFEISGWFTVIAALIITGIFVNNCETKEAKATGEETPKISLRAPVALPAVIAVLLWIGLIGSLIFVGAAVVMGLSGAFDPPVPNYIMPH